MSRLGKTPIPLPKGVEIKAAPDGTLQVKGPKGALQLKLPPGISFQLQEGAALLTRDEAKVEGRMHGLFRALLKNHIVGVVEGFEVRLSMVGVGYRANVAGNKLDLQVGFSHPTVLEIPKTLQVVVDKGTLIIIKGADRKEVGQFAAAVRAVKPPEPYKGKGIRYEEEYVRKKEGKAAKGKA
jgi:large subunit ribosomal protein L6